MRGDGDGHGGEGEGGAGVGIHAADEHVVSPDDEAEQADGDEHGGHDAVAEDATAGEVGEEGSGESHAGQDGDVDLGMSEEPEEMQPEERRAVAVADDVAVDQIAGGDKEARAEMAIGEEQHERGEQHG